MQMLRVYWPALLTLCAVSIAAGREARLQRHGPPHRLARPLNLWSLPILVWAFQTAVMTILWHESHVRLEAVGLRSPPLFVWISWYEAFLALCALVVLQIVAVSLLDRGRTGIGAQGHSRVAMIYAVVTVALDGFFLICMRIGRWPRFME